MKPALVLFDLDGTLIDSRRGIVHSLRLALEDSKVSVPEDHDFTWCLGASLWKIFEHYMQTTDRVRLEHAVATYRHIYRDGPMFEYDIYEGVAETLLHLTASGVRVAVATAKAHEYAREVIDASVLRNSIHHVYGSELDGTNVEKRDLLRHILAVEGTPAHDVIMIGDRHHDIDGARANGVANIGVLYGYGTAEELAHADTTVDSAAAITSAIAELEAPSR
jgi:phosphoglycolate phosphatase